METLLTIIQSELKAPKSQNNTFWKYKYRSAEDILEAVKPILKKHNAFLTISDEMVQVWTRIYVKSTVTLKWTDFEESVTAFAREPEQQKWMSESQITWTASSYARKYAMNWLFAIDDNKDIDTNEHKQEAEGKEEKKLYKGKFDLMDYLQRIKDETDVNALDSLYIEFMAEWPTQKQIDWFVKDCKIKKEQLI